MITNIQKLMGKCDESADYRPVATWIGNRPVYAEGVTFISTPEHTVCIKPIQGYLGKFSVWIKGRAETSERASLRDLVPVVRELLSQYSNVRV